MPRYRHMMSSLTRATLPSKVLIIDAVSTDRQLDNTEKSSIEEFASATFVQMKRIEGTYLKTASASFGTVSALYERIEEELQCGGIVWAFSYNLNRNWALLNFWEGLEDGRIRLVGREWRDADLNRRTMRALRLQQSNPLAPVSANLLNRERTRHIGYLVTECPPCIAKVKIGTASGWLHWVDTQNYSAIPPIKLQRGNQTCLAISEFVSGMLGQIGSRNLGSLCATAGSQAMQGFRFGHLKDGIYCHDNQEAEKIETAAYFGGRCEAYVLERPLANVRHVDIRSLYPYVCANFDMPVRLTSYVDYVHHDKPITDYLDNRSIAEVTITTDQPFYPYRRKWQYANTQKSPLTKPDWLSEIMQTDVIYPTGTFRTALCWPELEVALQYGHILKVHKVAYYAMAPALKTYADDLHNLRCETALSDNPMLSAWAKALLVALPGKFGQRERCWYSHPDESAPMMYGEWFGSRPDGTIARFRSLAGMVQEDRIGGLAYDSQMAIAAWITSAARTVLLCAMNMIGWDHIYYCDTDALVIDQYGYDLLNSWGRIRPNQMGCFHVKFGPGNMVIHGIKHYTENGRLVCAGLPRGYEQISGTTSVCDFRELPGKRIAKGQRPTSEASVRNYTRPSRYRHRTVYPDGTTAPIHVQEG